MRAGRFGMVENRGDIGCQVAERPCDVGLVALAGAAVVDHENLETFLHAGKKRLAPRAARAAESHDERDRIAVATNLVAQLETVAGLSKIASCHSGSLCLWNG